MAEIKISQLKMLLAASEAGSFSAASAELECTQSRVSHGIAELERAIGAKLLRRSPSGCALTEAGQRALVDAREILRLTSSIAAIGRTPASITGEVRIACIRSVGTHLLPYAIEALAEEYPGVHVEILDDCSDYDDVVRAVEDGDAQIGISRTPVGDHFVAKPFVSDPYVVVAPTSAQLQSPLSWEALATLPFIHIQQPGAMWIVDQCRSAGFRQRVARRLATESGIVAMVSRGLGYTILPRLAAFPDSKSTSILELPIPAKRQLTVFAKAPVARLASVRAVTKLILDKKVISRTEAWKARAIAY